MNLSDVIAIFSTCISIVAMGWAAQSYFAAQQSADAADRSAHEAKQANRLELHIHQKELFFAYQNLSRHLLLKGRAMEAQEVAKFYDFAITAPLYLPELLASQVKGLFDACFNVADINHQIVADQTYINDLMRVSPGAPVPPEILKSLAEDQTKQGAQLRLARQFDLLVKQGLLAELKLV